MKLRFNELPEFDKFTSPGSSIFSYSTSSSSTSRPNPSGGPSPSYGVSGLRPSNASCGGSRAASRATLRTGLG